MTQNTDNHNTSNPQAPVSLTDNYHRDLTLAGLGADQISLHHLAEQLQSAASVEATALPLADQPLDISLATNDEHEAQFWLRAAASEDTNTIYLDDDYEHNWGEGLGLTLDQQALFPEPQQFVADSVVNQPADLANLGAEAQHQALAGVSKSSGNQGNEAPLGGSLVPMNYKKYQSSLKSARRSKAQKKVSFSRRALAFMLVSCLLLSSALGLGGGWLAYSWLNADEADKMVLQLAPATVNVLSPNLLPADNGASLTPSQVAQITADSVVEVAAEIRNYSRFFGGSGRTQIGAGSGVIISDDGYIVTNHHVIENAGTITVTLRNGESFEAQLVNSDRATDVAVLKIEARGLSAAIIGDSSRLHVGDPAVVIGNPLGQLGGSVTVGVISALDREILIQGQTFNLLQTDASVNSGNSGGGLFNEFGQLVGIVMAKGSGADVEGLGFAIPINDVLEVIEDLIASGNRIMLGISMITITDLEAAFRHQVDELGVYVYRVERNSNAERAGLQPGDRLVTVNGQPIESANDIIAAVSASQAGDIMRLRYERNGQYFTTRVEMLPIVH